MHCKVAKEDVFYFLLCLSLCFSLAVGNAALNLGQKMSGCGDSWCKGKGLQRTGLNVDR